MRQAQLQGEEFLITNDGPDGCCERRCQSLSFVWIERRPFFQGFSIWIPGGVEAFLQGMETPAEPFPQSWPGVLCGGHLWEDTHQKVRVKTPKEIEDTPKGIYHERIPCHKFSTIPMHKDGYCLGPPILPFFQRVPLQSIILLAFNPLPKLF